MSSRKLKCIKQAHDFDCGLACVAMVTTYLTNAESPESELSRVTDAFIDMEICDSDSYTRGIWTIELYYLLAELLGERERKLQLSTTEIISNALALLPFYEQDIGVDTARVSALYSKLKSEGSLRLLMRRKSVAEITRDTLAGSVFIFLVDILILKCRSCRYFSFSNTPTEVGSYHGHCILVTSIDRKNGTVTYHDPSAECDSCNCELENFEAARSAPGTDNDAIRISIS